MRILIAEDDIFAAEMYKAALESGGHTVLSASDGRRCLNLYKSAMSELISKDKSARRVPFDVVVLDHVMPFINGLSAAKEIVRMCPEQRIIIASAFVKESLKDSLNELKQVVEFLLKPFEPDILVKVVEDISVVQKMQKLNTQTENKADIDQLLAQLKAIQKPGSI